MSSSAQIGHIGQETRQMTLEQWTLLPEDDARELVRGILVEEEVPSVIHEAVLAWLAREVGAWALLNGARIYGSGLKYRVADLTGRLPDATVYLRGSKRPPPRGLVSIAPSIAIEVVSPTPRDARRDRVEKLAEYAAFGVKWYWIVDPELRSFEILELDDQATYRHVIGAVEGVIRPPGCEGLTLDVTAVFRELDEVIAEGEMT